MAPTRRAESLFCFFNREG